ncbi:MAG: hypothetical protein Q9222_004280 [Ikaeria aurantiellina]
MVATESAREARKSFYCDLCNKGYGRINEFEAHEGSYDHLHKKRLRDLRHLSRDPSAANRARRAESKQNPDAVITIKPISSASNASSTATSGKGQQAASGGASKGFKKGGFKNAFAPVGGEEEDDDP